MQPTGPRSVLCEEARSVSNDENPAPGRPRAVLSESCRLEIKVDCHALPPLIVVSIAVSVMVTIAVIPGIAGVAPVVVAAVTMGVFPFPVAIRMLMAMFAVLYLMDIAGLHLFRLRHEDWRGV